jgi:2-polyprenyl-3-methyl-5-hydroxy-6-metoxy-1,4-benzoquinol methylase
VDIDLTDKNLSQFERSEINQLLTRVDRTISSDLDQMWYLIDLVWDDFNCDNANLNWENIDRFYKHPVWLLNGLFIEQDEISTGHRHAITEWIAAAGLTNVVDYGGGFGTLARMIASTAPTVIVNIYEPHPSKFAISRSAEFDNISITETLGYGYDCLVCTDVLEHVPDPLKNFSDMVDSVRVNGYLIIANAFSPMIKCHLPQTFHFRHSFNFFARLMGLEVIGKLNGSHATIYKKIRSKNTNWFYVRLFEQASRTLFPLIDSSKRAISSIKKSASIT